MSSKPNLMEFSINSIHEAVEYWLNNRVCRETVNVKKVQFNSQKNHFTVELETDTPRPEPVGHP